MNDSERRLSKWMAFVLRHQPQSANLKLDARGFCRIDDLVAAACRELRTTFTRQDVEKLCMPSNNPHEKTRYELEGNFVRAGHGHSIPINGYRVCIPVWPLYHATPRAAIEAIKTDGLKPMSRQKVHLSYDKPITIEAARRRGQDVVLIKIDPGPALAAGKIFYESADPRIVLSDELAPQFLSFPDNPELNAPKVVKFAATGTRNLELDEE